MKRERLTREKVLKRCLLEAAIGLLVCVVLGVVLAVKARVHDDPDLLSWEAFALLGVLGLAALVLLVVRDYRAGMARVRMSDRLETTPPQSPFLLRCMESYPGVLIDRTAAWEGRITEHLVLKEALEEKTLNVHRVILHLETTSDADGARDLKRLKDELRSWLRKRARGSWWRGVGVGMMISGRSPGKPGTAALTDVVDGSGAGTYVLQWLLYCNERSREMAGIHMCMNGRSTPCFAALVLDPRFDSYEKTFAVREASGVYKWAKKASDLFPWWRWLALIA